MSKYALALLVSTNPISYTTIGQHITVQYTLENVGSKTLRGELMFQNTIIGTTFFPCIELHPQCKRTYTVGYTITIADLTNAQLVMGVIATISCKKCVKSNYATSTLINELASGYTGPTGPTGINELSSFYASGYFDIGTISTASTLTIYEVTSGTGIIFLDGGNVFEVQSDGVYEFAVYVSYNAPSAQISLYITKHVGSGLYKVYPANLGGVPLIFQTILSAGDSGHVSTLADDVTLNPCFDAGFRQFAGYLTIKRVG